MSVKTSSYNRANSEMDRSELDIMWYFYIKYCLAIFTSYSIVVCFVSVIKCIISRRTKYPSVFVIRELQH